MEAPPNNDPEAPPPPRHLIDERTSEEYNGIIVPLYRALMEGDWEAATNILQVHPNYVNYSISENMETPLHVAAAVGHSTKFVRNLFRRHDDMNPPVAIDLELKNRDDNTAFCIAAISGNVVMAELMIARNPELPNMPGSKNMMPLHLAAFHGNREMVTFLYNITEAGGWTNDNRDVVLLKCIQAGFFDFALQRLNENEGFPQKTSITRDMLQVLARKPVEFSRVRTWPIISEITLGLVTGPVKESNATLLLRLLWTRIMTQPKDDIDEILRGPPVIGNGVETYPSQILFIAAEMKNTWFLVELISRYPDLIRKRNDAGQTIFHISVAHRHHKIFRLLYEIGSTKNLIASITDNQGNNILHLVGKNPQEYVYRSRVVPPFQMQRELLWYKEVENIVPCSCREVKNDDCQTPNELFHMNHKDLVIQSAKWIDNSISKSMVVAALVCTIGFSVVLTVPGGFNQDTGFPVFFGNNVFNTFIILSTMSFFVSATSIIMFLSIIISRRKGDPGFTIFGKWLVGQLLLLTSIISMVVAIAFGLYLLYGTPSHGSITAANSRLYMTYEVGAPLLAVCFIVLYHLFKDMIWALHGLKNLLKPRKHMLYVHKKPGLWRRVRLVLRL